MHPKFSLSEARKHKSVPCLIFCVCHKREGETHFWGGQLLYVRDIIHSKMPSTNWLTVIFQLRTGHCGLKATSSGLASNQQLSVTGRSGPKSSTLLAVLSPLQQGVTTNLARINIDGCQAMGIRWRPMPGNPVHSPHRTLDLKHNPSLNAEEEELSVIVPWKLVLYNGMVSSSLSY